MDAGERARATRARRHSAAAVRLGPLTGAPSTTGAWGPARTGKLAIWRSCTDPEDRSTDFVRQAIGGRTALERAPPAPPSSLTRRIPDVHVFRRAGAPTAEASWARIKALRHGGEAPSRSTASPSPALRPCSCASGREAQGADPTWWQPTRARSTEARSRAHSRAARDHGARLPGGTPLQQLQHLRRIVLPAAPRYKSNLRSSASRRRRSPCGRAWSTFHAASRSSSAAEALPGFQRTPSRAPGGSRPPVLGPLISPLDRTASCNMSSLLRPVVPGSAAARRDPGDTRGGSNRSWAAGRSPVASTPPPPSPRPLSRAVVRGGSAWPRPTGAHLRRSSTGSARPPDTRARLSRGRPAS